MERRTLAPLAKTDSMEGPRERLLRLGPASLSDRELLEIVLGGRRKEAVARELLESYGLRGMAELGANHLAACHKVGVVRASILVAALELGRRARVIQLRHGQQFDSSEMVAQAFQPRLSALKQECFYAVALSSKNRVIAELLISMGGLASCGVTPADVYRRLLLEGASGVIFIHNHPSGGVSPSADDRLLTTRLVQAGALLGVRVLDHVIVGHDGYFSFLDAGALHAAEESSSGADS